GLATWPVMNTFRLLMALTTTVTAGSSMNLFAAVVNATRSCSGVNPDACISLSNGSEILPSGRTATSWVISLSRQTPMLKTSSGRMTWAGGGSTPLGTTARLAAGAGGRAAFCCDGGVAAVWAVADAAHIAHTPQATTTRIERRISGTPCRGPDSGACGEN